MPITIYPGTVKKRNLNGTYSDLVPGADANPQLANDIAEEYDPVTGVYSVGDYCIYQSVFYKCITAISTPEAFDSTKWTDISVAEELTSQRNTLTQLDGAKAAKVDLTNISQTRPNCTVTNGIAKGTYFYLDGVLTRAIEAISENASYTSSNCETVTAGGLNFIHNNLAPTMLLAPTLATATQTLYSLNDSIYNYRLILICLGADGYRTQASNLIPIVNINYAYDVRFTDSLSASVVFTTENSVLINGSWNVSVYGINKI